MGLSLSKDIHSRTLRQGPLATIIVTETLELSRAGQAFTGLDIAPSGWR